MNRFSEWSLGRYLLIAFLLTALVSSILAQDPSKSFAKLLFFAIAIAQYYWVTESAWWTNKRLTGMVKFLLTLAFLLGAYAVYQYFAYIIQHGVLDISGEPYRATSFTKNPNSLAKFLLPFIPVAFILTFMSENTWHRVCYGLFTVIMLAGVVFSMARGAWLALFIAIGIIIISFRLYKLAIAIPVLAVGAIALLPQGVAISRFATIFNSGYQSNSERMVIWDTAVRMLKDHPYFGVGMNNFEVHYLKYKAAAGLEYAYGHAHNTFLTLGVEIGSIGLVFFLLFLIYLSFSIMGTSRTGVIAAISKALLIGNFCLLLYGLVEYNFNNELQIQLFFLQMAIAIKLVRNVNNRQQA